MSTNYLPNLLLSLVLILMIPLAEASPTNTLTLNNETVALVVNEQIQYIRDEEQSVTLQDILNGEYEGRFVYKSNQKGKVSNNISHYWFRFKLQRQSEQVKSRDWYLQFQESILKVKKIHFVYPDGRVKSLAAADNAQLTSDVMFNRFTTRFSLEAGEEVVVLINLLRASRMVGGVTIRSPQNLVGYVSKHLVLQGIFYGGLLLMLFYNLFLFTSVRDSAYLYYSLYLLGMGISYAHMGGFVALYIGEYKYFALSTVIFSSMTIGLTCYVLFLDKFLGLKKKFTFVRRAMPFFLAYTILSILYMTWQQNYYAMGIMFRVFVLMVGGLSLVPLIKLSLAGHRIAQVVLFATLLPISVLALFVSNSLGLTRLSSDVTSFLGRWALLTEFALLALALAGKFNFLQQVNSELREQSIKNLKKSEDLKREFLSTISHELRTPMNGVRGSLELIRLENEPERIKPYIKAVRSSADHMMGLIDSILDFITLDKGNIQMNSREFHLPGLLKELFNEVDADCTLKQLQFKAEVDDSLGNVRSDPIRISQVVKNLLSNAVKFTPSGEITVRVKRLASAELKDIGAESNTQLESIHDSSDNADILLVQVEDTGIGIAKNRMDEIFSAFQQGEGSFNRSHGGIGIGLTLTLKIVQLLGGELEVESEEGKGSTFTFTLPMEFVASDPVVEPQRNEPQAVVDTPEDLTVLVVEDNLVNQKVLIGILTSLGESVHACSNGEEAVEWCKSNQAHLIFMDCQMPVMDGFTATRAIRKLGGLYEDVPIVAVTANVTEGDRQQCREAGMDDFLSKPVKKVHIQSALAKWMGEDAA